MRTVIALTNEIFEYFVFVRMLTQARDGCFFGVTLREFAQIHVFTTNIIRHDCVDKCIHVAVAQRFEHVFSIGRIRSRVAGGESSAGHGVFPKK